MLPILLFNSFHFLIPVQVLYLRVAAPIFCKHVAFLFNISLATSTVAQQWKETSITPVPKIAIPTQHSDFRPISITPILTRMMERTVVRTFLYPAFLTPPPSLTFSDQFAFRPHHSSSLHNNLSTCLRFVQLQSNFRQLLTGYLQTWLKLSSH